MNNSSESIKREFRFFTITEYEEEQEYLRKRHSEGWKFTRVIFPGIYLFEKCEPEEVVYQLDYNQEGRSHMMEYIQIFEDCGWEYICDFVGYSYFRKPVREMAEEEEIFNDNSSKQDMLRRVFRGRMIPLLVIFTLVICPQMYMQAMIATPFSIGIFVGYSVLFVLYLIIFIRFVVKYREKCHGK